MPWRHLVSSFPTLPPSVTHFEAAWMLKQQIQTHGLTWESVARYHSATPALNQRYQVRLYAALQREMNQAEKTNPANTAKSANPSNKAPKTNQEAPQ
jgi:hypothetical protein